MEPYFYEINNFFFTELEMENLAKKMRSSVNLFQKSPVDNHNLYLPKKHIPFNLIQSMSSKISVDHMIDFICQKPRTGVFVHKDYEDENTPSRVSAITIPILPLNINVYNSTIFYKGDKDNYSETCTVKYKEKTSVILNLQELHSSVNTSDDYRICCQFTTGYRFEELVELHKKNKLIID